MYARAVMTLDIILRICYYNLVPYYVVLTEQNSIYRKEK